MPVTIPPRGHGGGGPGCRCGRDGRRGRGGRGGPLPCREGNPMFASNLRNSILRTSISPLPLTPAPSAAVPPLLLLLPGPSMLHWIVAILTWPTPRRGGPRQIMAPWRSAGTGGRRRGPADCGLSVRCASAVGGEGPYSPTVASFAICDRPVPQLAVTYPRHRL